jgi:hypothetical protein
MIYQAAGPLKIPCVDAIIDYLIGLYLQGHNALPPRVDVDGKIHGSGGIPNQADESTHPYMP